MELLPVVLKETTMEGERSKAEQKCETARNKKSRFSFLLIEKLKAIFSKISFNLTVVGSDSTKPTSTNQTVSTHLNEVIAFRSANRYSVIKTKIALYPTCGLAKRIYFLGIPIYKEIIHPNALKFIHPVNHLHYLP